MIIGLFWITRSHNIGIAIDDNRIILRNNDMISNIHPHAENILRPRKEGRDRIAKAPLVPEQRWASDGGQIFSPWLMGSNSGIAMATL